jgi:hypothetical protein
MKNLGYSDLINSVYRYHESWENIRFKVDGSKKYNQWSDKKEIICHIKKLMDELGHFPSREDLTARGESSLLLKVQKEYGGIYNIYKMLDIEPKRKPSGYWKDLENVINHLKAIEKELGHFPSLNELRQNDYSGLVQGIYKHHGSYRKIKDIFNIEYHQVPNGYFKDFNKVKEIILELQNKLNKFPNIIELEEFRPGIKYAILKYHGGYINVRKKLDAEIIQKPTGYWKNFNNIKKELLKLEKETGVFPTVEMIKEKGPKGLADGIFLYHGGINNVRELLNRHPIYPSALEAYVKTFLNRWVDDDKYLDNKKSELNHYGVYLTNPETKQPLEIDRYYYNARVAIEIQGHQHKYPATLFSKVENNPEKSFKKRKKLDFIKREQLQEQNILLIEINFNDSDKKILEKLQDKLKLRKTPLPAKIFDDALDKTTYHKYKNKHEAKMALLEIQNQIDNNLITSDIVRKLNSPLYTALKKFYGGINGGRDLINAKQIRNPRNSWTLIKVKNKVRELNKLNGHFPTKKELQNYEKGLYYAVAKHGGIKKIKEIL